MAKKGRIIVEIDEDGNPTITMEGLKGPACEKETKPLRDALGKTVSSVRTAEYHQAPQHIQEWVRR